MRAPCFTAVGRSLLVAIGLLGGLSAPGQADGGITLHVARYYSLFSSSDCQRTDIPGLDLALQCRFADRQAQFYLKEDMFTLPASPDETDNWAERELAGVLMNVDRSMIDRIRLFGGTGRYGPAGRRGGIFVRYGFRYKNVEDSKRMSQEFEKRIVLVGYEVKGVGRALLVAISDIDSTSIADAGRGGFGVPPEVLAMCASLGLRSDRAWME
jgi:hypothetical protein